MKYPIFAPPSTNQSPGLSSVPSVRKRIQTLWNARVIDHAGASEVGPWGYGDQAGRGLYVVETEFIGEYLALDSGRPATDGQLAELVLTSLGRFGCPVIRYRTGDVVRPRFEPTSANRFVLLEGGVLGRTDDMLIVRGVNVFPTQIEEQILKVRGLAPHYQLVLTREGRLDEMEVLVEAAPAAAVPEARAASAAELAHHVKGIEVYRQKLILYGCGDFIDDYEGIRGYEQFRDDLVLMYFPVVRAAFAEGFYPDTISFDLTTGGAAGCVKDLPTTMGKFLSLGMPLPDVIRAVTSAPARVLGRAGKLGTLEPGSVADVAVYALEEGSFDYEDAHGQHITGRQRFVPALTLRAGEVWWRGGPR